MIERPVFHHHDDDMVDAGLSWFRKATGPPFGKRAATTDRQRAAGQRRLFQKLSS
jgi:hypothetical protein